MQNLEIRYCDADFSLYHWHKVRFAAECCAVVHALPVAQSDADEGSETVTVANSVALQPPSMYRVCLLNDDITTMDFVVEILQKYFSHTRDNAIRIMMDVHVNGQAVCGVYPRDIAETKVKQVLSCARENGQPLRCMMEKD